MATTKRGKRGKEHPSPVVVCHPALGGTDGWRVDDDVELDCSVANGQKLLIRLTHDQALELCANLAKRLVMRFKPPAPVGGPAAAKVLL